MRLLFIIKSASKRNPKSILLWIRADLTHEQKTQLNLLWSGQISVYTLEYQLQCNCTLLFLYPRCTFLWYTDPQWMGVGKEENSLPWFMAGFNVNFKMLYFIPENMFSCRSTKMDLLDWQFGLGDLKNNVVMYWSMHLAGRTTNIKEPTPCKKA